MTYSMVSTLLWGTPLVPQFCH